MASHDNDSSDLSATTPPMAIEVGLPLPQVYPRTHLLDIPQELQDLIMDEVFQNDPDLIDAQALRPLLTCRHIYHIANVKAWTHCGFVIGGLTEAKVAQLKASIPTSIRKRKVRDLTISRSQLLLFSKLEEHLPRVKFIFVLTKQDDSIGETMFDRNETADDRWFRTVLLSTALTPMCDMVFLPRDAFKKEVVKAVVDRSVALALARATGMINSDVATAVISHAQVEGCPEAYMVTMIGGDLDLHDTRNFAVWSAGPPYKKPVERQSEGAEGSTTTENVS